MRTLVEPPPSSRCELCGGELRLKQIKSANPTRDLDNEICVCENCDGERAYAVNHYNRTHTVA